MIFKPRPLSRTMLDDASLVRDKQHCRRIGPCGVGRRALYLNSYFIDRHYYVPFSVITRAFKFIEEGTGGVRGVLAGRACLLVEYDGGMQQVCCFKYEDQIDELLRVLHTAERLKDETRHCYTSGGRRESVAEHSWRLALTALFLRDEFPALDMDRVIRMCLIHDLGECFTGDIPSFLKSGGDEERERSALEAWVASLPAPYSVELKTLYAEMDALETDEARLYKALDKLEAVIQHNESDIATWLPREYELNLTYADENVAFSDYLKQLREEIRRETRDKIAAAEHNRH